MATHANRAVHRLEKFSSAIYPRLLTLKKASDFLGLTVWALRERIWAGHIPVVQFPGGRKQYVDIRDLEGFIETHKRKIV
jgi:predicted site-specific integrase-resolvase